MQPARLVAYLRDLLKQGQQMIERDENNERFCGRQPGTYIQPVERPWIVAIINNITKLMVLSELSLYR